MCKKKFLVFLNSYQGSGADLTKERRRTVFYVTRFVWLDISFCFTGIAHG